MADEPDTNDNQSGPDAGTALAERKERAPLVAGEGGYIMPTTMEEAYRFAVAVVNAKLAPDSYGNDPSTVMLGIAAAMEAGLPPLYGLRNIAIINKRPTIWGDAAMALIHRSGLLTDQKVQEVGPAFERDSTAIAQWPDDFGIAVSMWRRGTETPFVGRFTVGDAKRAKLWMNTAKAPWMNHPLRMMTMRARAFALRDGFADALAGLAIREEVEDIAQAPAATDASFLDDAPAQAEADAPQTGDEPILPLDADAEAA